MDRGTTRWRVPHTLTRYNGRLMNYLLQWIRSASSDPNIIAESQLRRRVFDYACLVVGRVTAKNTLSEARSDTHTQRASERDLRY